MIKLYNLCPKIKKMTTQQCERIIHNILRGGPLHFTLIGSDPIEAAVQLSLTKKSLHTHFGHYYLLTTLIRSPM